MEIKLENIGKQYKGEWIFKSISLSFLPGDHIHIAGGNGMGKSTLLKVIAGLTIPSKGSINFVQNGMSVEQELLIQYISICAPFITPFEKHTVQEAVNFHLSLRPQLDNIDSDRLLDICYLNEARDKRMSELSSGMQQRLKIALAILSKSAVLLLDEPCSNLDEKAIEWYQELLTQYAGDRLILVSSNNKPEEHFICKKTINLADYKN